MIHDAYSHERSQSIDSVPLSIALRDASADFRQFGQFVA